MNVFCFTGNIGKAEPIKYTQSGKAILSFSVAVNKGYGDNKKVSWLRCILWEKRAESLKDMIDKGVRVTISGEYYEEKWQDKEGHERSTPTIDIREIDIHSTKERHLQPPGPPPRDEFDHPGDSVPF